MSRGRAFTLIEVLVVLTLIGLTFSILLFVFSRGVNSSLSLSESSEKLKAEASLFWELQRKVVGARKIKVDREGLYMITSGGSFNEGVVKCAYLYKEGELYYYEFPYPYGAIDEVEEEELYRLGTFEEFKVVAVERNREFALYEGLPEFLKVHVNGREFLLEFIR